MNHNLPIGIDISRDGVNALQLITNARGIKLKAAASQPFKARLTGSAEDTDVLLTELRALIGRRAFKGKRAVISLPAAYLFAFPVTIETNRQDPFEAALTRACSKHLSFPIEEAVIDYLCVQDMVNPGVHQQRVTVVAAHRKPIDLLMNTFKRAGLKVDTIDYGLCALVRLHNHIHRLSNKPSILVHMKNESTLMVVATEVEIIAHRHLDWGIGRLQQSLIETLQIEDNHQQAHAMLHDFGVGYDALQTNDGKGSQNPHQPDTDKIATMRVASQILMPYLDELVHELFQMIGYARSISPELQFQEIWLYGEATRINSLGPFLEKRLQIHTQCMDLSAKLALDENNSVAAAGLHPYTIALGLALREAI